MPATTFPMLSRSLYAAITIATGEELIDGDTIDQLVDLSPAAQSAGVRAERLAEAAASMSAAVTWRSAAVSVGPWERARRVRPAAISRQRRRSRNSGGGGKYSSSSVVCTTSTPLVGARRSRRSSISQSGADAPAVTPTTPVRSSGTSLGALTRSTLGQPAAAATFARATVFEELPEPSTTIASHLGATALTAL